MFKMQLHYFTNGDEFPLFIHYGEHDEDLPMHIHDDFSELVIVISGSATHLVDNERYVIQKGDVFVIGSDTAHGYENTSDFTICNVMYRPETLFSSKFDIIKSAGFHAMFVIEPQVTKEHKFNSKLKLDYISFEKVKEITDMMVDEYNGSLEGRSTILNGLFTMLIVTLSRLYNFGQPLVKTDAVYLAKAISYIENHFAENITVDKLAEIANYSPRHFSRMFYTYYNTTPNEYIMNLRLKNARLLLRQSKKTIVEIALECGFNDSNYFSRVFKKRFGVRPIDYRKNP